MASLSPNKEIAADTRNGSLTPLETEVIELFVHVADVLGLPRSVAEIYGLLYASPRPLTMDDLIIRLRVSKGSASQGLRFLRTLGAVQTVYVAGDRRDSYQAEMKVRKLAVGFLRDQVEPRLGGAAERLARMDALVRELPAAERAAQAERIQRLKTWHRNGRKLLPLILRLMG
jgi:DNA-binding transcriptional regulator GbsR (MarR family)